jgi:Xaa-Pro aminopeptidase
VHDSLADTNAEAFWATFTQLRRAKDPDELEMIRLCCRVAEFGFEWAYANVKPGMTELDVYLGVSNACARAAGEAVVVYGDFAVSPGPSRKGGPPTAQRLNPGETFILDYSVVLQGYRSDFTTTLAVGGAVRAEVKTMFELCQKAMAAGESQLKPGTPCQTVYDAVAQVFADAGMKDAFPHHAGHGLGISHPEAPFFVSKSEEALVIGDVVTLEPGLYVEGTGGIRIEHNYAITPDGYERLSQHDIRLT